MSTRRFRRDEKLDAVKSILAGTSIERVAVRLSVDTDRVEEWVQALGPEVKRLARDADHLMEDDREVTQLRVEVERLKQERDSLLQEKRSKSDEPRVAATQILAATEDLMVSEGYAAVTTRRVAKQVGVTPALVHYYFPTTDDLLLGLVQRKQQRHEEGVRVALQAKNPVRALWNFYSDQSRTVLGIELSALANHRKGLRSELAKDTETSRKAQENAIAQYFEESGIDASKYNPASIAMLISGMGRAFVGEKMLGVSHGHSETSAFMERLLQDIESTRKAEKRKPKSELGTSVPKLRNASPRRATRAS